MKKPRFVTAKITHDTNRFVEKWMLVEYAINPLKDIFFQSMIYLQAIMTPINKITLPVSLQLGRSSSERTAYSILIKPKYDSLIQKKMCSGG